jgi:LAO/AO transport system kinase
MAARTRLGGLADATRAGVLVLAAAFDRVLVETVGVGQSEAEVATLVDTLVLVVGPGSGDELQFMKAGLLELPDLFLVNKSDLGPPAERTAAELRSALGLAAQRGHEAPPPVLLASARDGTGVEALVQAIDAHREAILASGELAERRRRAREAHVLDALERRYGSYGLECGGGRESLRRRVAEDEEATAFGLLARLSAEIEEALRKGPA